MEAGHDNLEFVEIAHQRVAVAAVGVCLDALDRREPRLLAVGQPVGDRPAGAPGNDVAEPAALEVDQCTTVHRTDQPLVTQLIGIRASAGVEEATDYC